MRLIGRFSVFLLSWALSEALVCPSDQPENVLKSIKLPGCCPRISYVSNLLLDRIQGQWFQQYTTYPSPACEGCQNAVISRFNEVNTTVDYCCSKGGQRVCGREVGSGVLSSPNLEDRGDLTYTISGEGDRNFFVDVKYDEYLVLYGCFDLQGKPLEYVSVVTRDPRGISEDVYQRIRELLRKFGVDVSRIQKIQQYEGCPYRA